MNENLILDNQGRESGLIVTQIAQQALRKSANWGLFLAVMGFIGIGFMLIAGVAMIVVSAVASNEFGAMSPMPFPMAYLSIFYFIIAVFYFFPTLFLLKFSQETKRALVAQSNETLEKALVNLGKMYQWVGIMVIALVVIYILVIIGVVVFGAMAASAF